MVCGLSQVVLWGGPSEPLQSQELAFFPSPNFGLLRYPPLHFGVSSGSCASRLSSLRVIDCIWHSFSLLWPPLSWSSSAPTAAISFSLMP